MWFLNRKKERERINNVLGLWCLGDWCLVFDGLVFFFYFYFYFLLLMVDYGLLEVVVVSGVCSVAAVGSGGHVVMVFFVKFVVVEQKE